MRSLHGIARGFVLFVLLLLAGSRIASASHFHAGTLSWEQDLTYSSSTDIKVSVTAEVGFRWSFPFTVGMNPPVGMSIADQVNLVLAGQGGYSNSFFLPVTVTSTSAADDLLIATGSIDLIIPAAALPVTVQYANCCRASTLAEGNHDLNYMLTTVIDTNLSNGAPQSPRSTGLPRVRLPLNVASTFGLPNVAFDGFTNRFSFAPTSVSGLLTPRPNGSAPCATGTCTDLSSTAPPYTVSMQLTNPGVVTWTPSLAGLYSAQFTITSVDSVAIPRASIPVDIEFEVLLLCGPGSLSASGEPPCTPAPAGSYVSIYGATSATLCPAGTYSSSAGATQCNPAPAGSYAAGQGNTVATLCTVGTYSSTTGAASCTPAPPGSYVSVAGSTAPALCPAGTFSSAVGATSAATCTPAPAGSYVGVAGSTSATLCPVGTFSATAGASSCTAAPIGSYVSSTGASSATPCPVGTFSATVGASFCTPAPMGFYVSATGASSATPCPVGTFSATAGASSCTPAPMGSYVSGTGASSATPCPVGTFSATAGASSCTPAPTGSYVSGTGASSATPCPVGTFSATTGASSCTPAPMGSYVSSTGASSATPCVAGTFSSTTGQAACTPAAAGSYASGPGAGGTGATSSTLCAAGTFSSTSGAAACTPCPTGTSSAPGATSCSAITLHDQLASIASSLAPYVTNAHVQQAIGSINKALLSKYWADGNSLTKDGQDVFNLVHDAINNLLAVTSPAAAGAAAQTAITNLVNLCRNLVVNAIQYAINHAGNAKEIALAQQEMTAAQSDLDKGHPDSATTHYGNAWLHAWHAVSP